jgi:predicted metal-dependent HD superfamily phosphohydrolase
VDLSSRWAGAWRALGASPEPALLARLIAAYSEPHRHYHTLRHLEECFAHLQSLGSLAQHPAEVELALWFHDAIYDTRRRDSERRSAEWACQALSPVSSAAAKRVASLVMATRHAAAPEGIDAQVLVDVDLAILGAPAERFDEYELQVRREYAWAPLPLYRRARRRILESLLARAAIYATAQFVERYEAQARDNLARSLARL